MIKIPYRKSPYNPSATPGEICSETCRIARCSSYSRTKTFRSISGRRGAERRHPLKRWMVLALTERSFPAHLHSSLLVGEAGQGICNIKRVPVHVRKESLPQNQFYRVSWKRSSLCARMCVYESWRGVTLRFVIHFVLVYSIIHPGVQRAANMPGTVCDRVQQPRSEIFMRHFSVETAKRVPRHLRPCRALRVEMHRYKRGNKSVRDANRLGVCHAMHETSHAVYRSQALATCAKSLLIFRRLKEKMWSFAPTTSLPFSSSNRKVW